MAESEQRLAEALRAHASGAGRPAPRRAAPPGPAPAAAARPVRPLLLALLAGVLLGVAMALVTLLAPGVLPG
jgi:hypothetical protein